jgi:heme-degrading monooxygenase HmoA
MFSVIFEVFPRNEKFEEYLGLAKQLKPLLEKVDGFVDNERFGSRRRPGWILSHSSWRDEKSVVRWRTTGEHHMIQQQGRDQILNDYHLRVGDVTYDTNAPREAPIHEQRFDETETGVAKIMTLTEIVPRPGIVFGSPDEILSSIGLNRFSDHVLDNDIFESIYNPGKQAILLSWEDAITGNNWNPIMTKEIQALRHRRVRIVRDYGMFDRRESPQFFADAKGRATIHAKTIPEN